MSDHEATVVGPHEVEVAGQTLGTLAVAASLSFSAALEARLGVRGVVAFMAGAPSPFLVPLWSSAMVGGVPVSQYRPKGKRPITVQERSKIAQAARESEPESAAEIVARAIRDDARVILPVTTTITRLGEAEIAPARLAFPCVVGAGGVVRVIEEWPLNDAERAALLQQAGG